MPATRFTEQDHTRLWEHLNSLATDIDTMVGAVTPAWSSYAVAWSQSDGTTLSIGNGTLEGRWMQVGRLVHASVSMGRGSTTHVGSAAWVWSMPVNARAWAMVAGVGWLARGGSEYPLTVRPVGPGRVAALIPSGRLSNNNPGGWASGDSLFFTMTYEV
ncbi:hypothetical protein ACTND8_08925 [Atopobiaceae bacterium HCP3S3_F7]